MEVFIFLIPITIVMVSIMLLVLVWSIDNKQYDDLNQKGSKILFFDERNEIQKKK